MPQNPPDIPAWAGVIFTVVAGVVAGTKAFFSFATKAELATALKEMQETIERIHKEDRAEVLRLHEENQDARHRLAEQLSSPILELTKEVGELKGELKVKRTTRSG